MVTSSSRKIATAPVVQKSKAQRRSHSDSLARPNSWRERLLDSPLPPALFGALLVWLSLPPLGYWLWPLAWVAPVPWIGLIRRRSLPGCRPYRMIYLAGVLYWMAECYFLTLPHWSTSFGWIALAVYLGAYLPLFVGLTRTAVHRFGVSPVLAAPVVWTGLEWARAHVLGGFLFAALGHSQFAWTTLIQISDLAGGYAVSFLVMLVAASIARMLPLAEADTLRRAALWPIVPATVALGAALVYGSIRIGQEETADARGPKIALIQGSIDTQFGLDRETYRRDTHEHYLKLSHDAVLEHTDLDLVVWPESMFTSPLYEIADGVNQDVPRNDPVTQFSWDECREFADISSGNFIAAAEEIGVPILVGADTAVFDTDQTRRYASSVFVNVRPVRNGQGVRANIESRYDKMHPVMFGEYVPLGDVFPALYDLTPLDGGVDPGQAPRSIPIGPGGAMRAAPNICYENVLPHLIGRQVRTLRAQGAEPELLISQSNDGWFWGSAELDLHLICAVFRAVECRKPLLIAANTGFSAWIDGNGKIVKQGPRHAAAVLLAEPKPDARTSWYLDHGDLPVQLCAACCAVFALAGCWFRFRPRDADVG